MNECKSCKWFNPDPVELQYASYGKCERGIVAFDEYPSESKMVVDTTAEDVIWYWVGVEFGCIHWEKEVSGE